MLTLVPCMDVVKGKDLYITVFRVVLCSTNSNTAMIALVFHAAMVALVFHHCVSAAMLCMKVSRDYAT